MGRTARYFTFLLIIINCISQAQRKPAIDSVIRLLSASKEDSAKIELLIGLAADLKFSKVDSAMIIARQAKNLAIALDMPGKEARAIKLLGDVQMTNKRFEQALEIYNEVIPMFDKLNNEQEKANTFSNIGVCYYNLGEIAKALENYYKALKIYEKLNDESGQSTALGNIGIVHLVSGKMDKSLEYAEKALEIARKMNNTAGIGRHLGNIATVYQHQGSAIGKQDSAKANQKFRKALASYAESFEIARKTSDNAQMALVLDNMANTYYLMGDTARCLEYFNKAYVTDKEIANREGMSQHLGNIGWICFEANRLQEAEKYTREALDLLQGSSYIYLLSNYNENLSEIYEKLGKTDLALKTYKLAIQYRDSLYNIENAKKQLEAEMNFEFDKKEAIAKQESARQVLIRNVFIGGFALMLVLVIVVFRGYRSKKKANEIISQQKTEVENQKLLVEMKNKEITDSIRYAKRIQKSLMSSEKYIERTLKNGKS